LITIKGFNIGLLISIKLTQIVLNLRWFYTTLVKESWRKCHSKNKSKAMSEKKRVLVIGYGGAGSQATAHLAKNPNLRVTVVTPFDFMEVTLCTAKFLGLKEKVEEEHDKYMFPLLKEDNVEYVIASCTSLSNSSATLSNGQTIDFDACVVATGLKFPIFQLDPSHPSKEFRNSEIMGLNSSVQKAKHIVISGGGPVGCEAAADIKLRSPDKRLVIFSIFYFLVAYR